MVNANFQQILTAIDSATAGLTEDQLLCHPQDKWSSAQILEHLALAFGGTARLMKRCCDEGRLLGTVPSLKQRAVSMIVVDFGFFPNGRAAPKIVTPQGQLQGMAALELIRNNLSDMDQALTQCEKQFGRQGWVDHPILGPLTLRQWSKFHLVHTRHHMKQILGLRNLRN